ncbi:MAG: hypothetical protein KDC79_07520 [Cyclobacteriaceae bacterium]|nr:hypothetical protein [Cyclobacteriaceae bacterium]
MPRHAPEETAPSYWLAKKLGADYLEADLQRTKDSVLICLHDSNLKRTTNILELFPDRADSPVSDFTLDELKQLDAGSWFNKENPDKARDAFKGQRILTLEELIEIAESGGQVTGLYLETKKPELFPGIEKDLYKLLEQKSWVNNPNKKLILQTFSTKSLVLLNQYFADTPKCMLLWNDEEFLTGGATPDKLKQALAFGKANGATIVGPSFKGEMNDYYNLMKKWMVKMYHKEGYLIHPYTFDTKKDEKEYVPLSDGQFTNRTDLLLDYYKRSHETVNAILNELGYE